MNCFQCGLALSLGCLAYEKDSKDGFWLWMCVWSGWTYKIRVNVIRHWSILETALWPYVEIDLKISQIKSTSHHLNHLFDHTFVDQRVPPLLSQSYFGRQGRLCNDSGQQVRLPQLEPESLAFMLLLLLLLLASNSNISIFEAAHLRRQFRCT